MELTGVYQHQQGNVTSSGLLLFPLMSTCPTACLNPQGSRARLPQRPEPKYLRDEENQPRFSSQALIRRLYLWNV
jgi:hypothetical protein